MVKIFLHTKTLKAYYLAYEKSSYDEISDSSEMANLSFSQMLPGHPNPIPKHNRSDQDQANPLPSISLPPSLTETIRDWTMDRFIGDIFNDIQISPNQADISELNPTLSHSAPWEDMDLKSDFSQPISVSHSLGLWQWIAIKYRL